ncbi:MAG: FkbM family methyltransferase [Promethearchaeota archaeon]
MKKIILKFIITSTKLIPNGLPLIILRGPLKGFKLIAGAPAGPAKGLSYLLNLSEPKWLEMGKIISSKDDVCIDIGANIGIYSLLFSRHAKFVYSFEPYPRNLDFFRKMMAINHVKNVKIYPYGISNKIGKLYFRKGNSIATGRLTKEGDFQVNTITLDYFIELTKIEPSIIKIDVEGLEFSVLKGAEDFLKRKKPMILIETHGPMITKKILKYLKAIGYNKFKLISSNDEIKTRELLIKRK